MKKLAFITALCLLCGCMVGCTKEQTQIDDQEIVAPPIRFVSFASWDEISECYEILQRDDQTVNTFLREKGYYGTGGVYNRDDLQDILQQMEKIGIPYLKKESEYVIEQIYYCVDYPRLDISYCKGSKNTVVVVCREYDPQWEPPRYYRLGEDTASIVILGKQISLKRRSQESEMLNGYYADDQVQFTLQIDEDSNGKVDNTLQDAFVITDLRTLLFGEE